LIKYVGTKIIDATPMTHGEFAKEKYKEPIETDFSLKNKDTEGYKVIYDGGYASWSPKEVFEKAYRPIDSMLFGLAIELAKNGYKVARRGWNGKGMFVVYQKGYPEGIPCNKQTAEAFGINEGDLFICNPYLQIKQVNGSASMWVPSVSDVLADDWTIYW